MGIELGPDEVAATRQAIGWVASHLEEFDPFTDPQAFSVRRGQRIGELALAAYVCTALDRPEAILITKSGDQAQAGEPEVRAGVPVGQAQILLLL